MPLSPSPPPPRRVAWGWPVFIALTAGGAYLATLLRTVGTSGDVAKFQFVGHVLGTPHAPGYPLYMVASYLFTHLLPVGTVPFRANLLSAVFAVVALVLVYRTLVRGLDVAPAIAAMVTLVFAFTPTFWSQALVAEVYSLHLCFVAGGIYLLLHHFLLRRRLWPGLAVLALGFAHHLTIVVLLPAVAAFLIAGGAFRGPQRLGARHLPAFFGLAALGAVPYLYIFWRWSDASTRYLEMQAPNLASLLWYLTGAQFRGRFPAFSPAELGGERLPMLLEVWGRQLGLGSGLPDALGWVLVLSALSLCIVGLWRLGRRPAQWLLMGTLVGNTLLALSYDIPDIAAYFLPSTLILVLYLGLGLEALSGWLSRPLGRRLGSSPGAGSVVAAGLVGILAASLFVVHRPTVDLSSYRRDADRAEAMLTALPADAVVVTRSYLAYETLLCYRLLGLGDGDIVVLGPLASAGVQAQIQEFLEEDPPPRPIRELFEATRNAEDLRRYLEDAEPLYLTGERRWIAPGRPVFADGEEQRRLLKEADLETHQAPAALFRITAGQRSGAGDGEGQHLGQGLCPGGEEDQPVEADGDPGAGR